jgi:hypothetical protein
MKSRTTTTTMMSTSSIALFLLLSGAGQYQLAHSLEPVRLRRGQSSHSGPPARTQKARRMYHDDDIDDDDDYCNRSSSSGLIDPYIVGNIPCLTVSDCEWKYEMLVYNHLTVGYFYTDETNPGAYGLNGVKGCFMDADDNVYFVGGGTIEEMSTYLYSGPGTRVWCDEKKKSFREEKKRSFSDYWLPSFSMDISIAMHMSMPEGINW